MRHIQRFFLVNKKLRQGCCLTPTVLKIYLKSAIKQWSIKCSQTRVHIGDRNLYTVICDNGQVLLTEDEEDADL